MTGMGPVAELDARFSDDDAEPTPWPALVRVLEEAELFWSPRSVPGEGRTSTPLRRCGRTMRFISVRVRGEKAVNLARNSWCALTTGNNRWKTGLDVVMEGRAERVVDEARLQRLAAAWESKYHGDWHFEVADGAFQGGGGEALVFEVAPPKCWRSPRAGSLRPATDSDRHRVGVRCRQSETWKSCCVFSP